MDKVSEEVSFISKYFVSSVSDEGKVDQTLI